MTSDPRPMTRIAALIAIVLAAMAALPASADAAQSGATPYCVKLPGSLGPDSGGNICRFFDFQQCLQAAADLRGNCVANVDYRGGVAPAPRRAQRQRYSE